MDTSINPADLPDQIPAKKKVQAKKRRRKKKETQNINRFNPAGESIINILP